MGKFQRFSKGHYLFVDQKKEAKSVEKMLISANELFTIPFSGFLSARGECSKFGT